MPILEDFLNRLNYYADQNEAARVVVDAMLAQNTAVTVRCVFTEAGV